MGKRIAVILILGAVAIGAIYLSQPKQDKGTADIAATNTVLMQSAERLKQLKLDEIELQLGSTDFNIYQLCHKSPPTTKENKRLCARVERKLAAKQAEAKAHPW